MATTTEYAKATEEPMATSTSMLAEPFLSDFHPPT